MPSQLPHIVVVLSDEHRGQAMSHAGDANLRTPALDRLAAAGVSFRRAYANCPVCTPSRGTIFSGRHAHAGPVAGFFDVYKATAPSLATELRRHGYHTAYFGKWHCGIVQDQRPAAVREDKHRFPGGSRHRTPEWHRAGFQDWVAFESLNKHFDVSVYRNDALEPERLEGYETDVLTDEAIRYLREYRREQPLFLVLSVTPPHFPLVVPDQWKRWDPATLRVPPNFREHPAPPSAGNSPSPWGKEHPGWAPASMRQALADYYAMIENLDWNIGRLSAALTETNTVFSYISDHGEFLGSHGLCERKEHPHEEGVRVPALFHWPGHVAARGLTDGLFGLVDFAPTLLGLIGAPVPAWMQGRDFSPALRGEPFTSPDALEPRLPRLARPRDGALEIRLLRDRPRIAVRSAGRPLGTTQPRPPPAGSVRRMADAIIGGTARDTRTVLRCAAGTWRALRAGPQCVGLGISNPWLANPKGEWSMTNRLLLALGILGAGTLLSPGAEEWEREQPARWGTPPPPAVLKNAENHHDIVYLPDRVVGHDRDRWVRMNIHVPKSGTGPFPCLVFVHGGGYWNGDKDHTFTGSSSPSHSMLQRAVDAGYVAVNLNYILGRGIKPQVYWDFRAAIRFLRANAAAYKIDAGRIGAWGFSAGGWLSGSAAFSTADDEFSVAATPTEPGAKRAPASAKFFLPMDDPRPVHGEQSSRLSCVLADFWENTQFLSADDPAVLGFAGSGVEHVIAPDATKGGANFTAFVLLDPKYAGKAKVHGPDYKSPVRHPFGDKELSLLDAAFQWVDDQLKIKPRTIPPEARPNQRRFTGETTVTLLAAAPGTKIHYTTDGSDPTGQSPLYSLPIRLTGTTTVKAIASRPGEMPSAMAAFSFRKEPPPPTITEPVGPRLPVAKIGRPYRVEFRAAGTGARAWNLAGHIQLGKPGTLDKEPEDATGGLRFDAATGILAGTPMRPGVFTFQVQVAGAPGLPADARTYLLNIEQ
jgi:arylsulfatase A-like enzyme